MIMGGILAYEKSNNYRLDLISAVKYDWLLKPTVKLVFKGLNNEVNSDFKS